MHILHYIDIDLGEGPRWWNVPAGEWDYSELLNTLNRTFEESHMVMVF